MDFNQSVKSMGTKMTHFGIDEARVKKRRGTFTPTGGAYWDETHTQDGMPMHKCLAELCKRVLIHNNYRVELHPLSKCDKGGSDLKVINEVGIKHPNANYYTAVIQWHRIGGYFIVASPRINRYKSLHEAGHPYYECAMKSNDINRAFTALNKLLPIKDRELLLGITGDRQHTINSLIEADERELKSVATSAFRWLDSDDMRSALIRLLKASKEGVVAPYVDDSGDGDGPIDCYEKYLKKKAILEESVKHNTGQVPVHIIRTFTGDALYCRYHSDIDETTEDVYAPIFFNDNPAKHAGDWRVYQRIEQLPEALHSKIMTLNVSCENTNRDYELRGVGMMFGGDNVVKEHYVVFVKEDEEVFSL